MYEVVHYREFGFETETILRTPSLESALKTCNWYGDMSDIEEGYYVLDVKLDTIVRGA